MLNEKLLAEELLRCQDKRKAVQGMTKVLAEWDVSLKEEETALRALTQVSREAESFERRFKEAQLSLPGMGLPPIIEVVAPVKRRRRKDGKKPDVQVMEEIYREYGPLHVTDLIPIARSRGVQFKGRKKPTIQARDKMYGSKRFVLFGNNVWGLPNQELPEQYNGKGHEAESPIRVE